MSTRLNFFVVVLMLLAVPAFAQTRVRVARDQTNIWRADFLVISRVVSAGTELEVVSRRGDWYEVVLPAGGATRETGLIAVSQVVALGGTPAPSSPLSPTAPGRLPPPSYQAARPRASVAVHDSGVRGFAQTGYGWFTANQSFNAIFGKPGGLWYGGGIELRANDGLFAAVSAERFHQTGQRAFVADGEVFDLGIPDTITITPLTFTAGYRFSHRRVIPYIGVGAGEYVYSEESQGADPSENVSTHFASYHVLLGVEWRSTGWLGTAIEAQYTRAPDQFTGLADAFNEHDLGGIQARVKLLIGK